MYLAQSKRASQKAQEAAEARVEHSDEEDGDEVELELAETNGTAAARKNDATRQRKLLMCDFVIDALAADANGGNGGLTVSFAASFED